MYRVFHIGARALALSVAPFRHAYCETQNIEENLDLPIVDIEEATEEAEEKKPPIPDNVFLEPYTYTRFQPEIKVSRVKIKKSEREIRTARMNFVGAGLRCMLGESALCHIKSTRVYSFGLYVNHKMTKGTDYETTILSHCPGTVKTIRIFSNVTKTGKHWATGYKQSLRRRVGRYNFTREQRRDIYSDTKKFVKVFKQMDLIPAGTEIFLTWADNKLVIEIDGEVKEIIRNNTFAELVFRVYLAKHSINNKVSEFIRKSWYSPFDVEGDSKQKWLRSLNKEQQEIHQVKCVLKGANYDTFMTSNLGSQNRDHNYNPSSAYKAWCGDDDWDDEVEDDEGMYYIPPSARG